MSEINGKTNVTLPLRNVVSLIGLVAVATWAYGGLTTRLTNLETQNKLSATQIEANSNFRIKWPLGELGALPDDAEQNMKLVYLQKAIEAQRLYLLERIDNHLGQQHD